MNIAVCDDEKEVREYIGKCISTYEKTVCHIFYYENGEQLCLAKETFDVIFLDIDMDGMNGIESAKLIRKRDKNVKIIYVTSYQEYVNSAFSVHAFAYVLKPVTKEVIFRQLDEVLDYVPRKRMNPTVEFITDNGLERLAVNEIYYFEYLNRKIYMHTAKGAWTLRGRIMDIQNKMADYHFAMPHKSFVVNLYHVKAVKGYDIRMMNGDIVPLSQKKSTGFRAYLSEFLVEYIGD